MSKSTFKSILRGRKSKILCLPPPVSPIHREMLIWLSNIWNINNGTSRGVGVGGLTGFLDRKVSTSVEHPAWVLPTNLIQVTSRWIFLLDQNATLPKPMTWNYLSTRFTDPPVTGITGVILSNTPFFPIWRALLVGEMLACKAREKMFILAYGGIELRFIKIVGLCSISTQTRIISC